MKNPIVKSTLALALAACSALAQAGAVSLSIDKATPLVPGDRVTFSVSDERARDMFDPVAGFSAADFSLHYDMAALAFESMAYAPWVTSAAAAFWADNASAPPAGEVLVTMAGFDETELPDLPGLVFSVSFRVLPARQGLVTVAPLDPPSYVFDPANLEFSIRDVPLPLPSTLSLLAAGLLTGVMTTGLARRRSAAR